MNYRLEQIWKDKVVAATSGTLTEDITVRQPISRLHLTCLMTTTTGADTGHPDKAITKFELTDGSDVLVSLTGKQMRALQFFNGEKAVYVGNIKKGAEKCWFSLDIDFGRWLWDEVFSLLPDKFKNLQLKITYDATLVGTTTSHKFNLTAFIFDDKKVSPAGFMMSKEVYSYVPSVNATEYITLPIDHPYRRLILQGISSTKDAVSMFDTITLSEDGGARKPLNDTTSATINYMNLCQFGLGQERVKTYASTTADAHYICFTRNPSFLALGQRDTDTLTWDYAGGGQMNIKGETAGDHAYEGYVLGSMPHGCLILPTGENDDIKDWYNVTKLGQLRLEVKAKAAVGTSPVGAVIIQQVRSY